MLQMIPESLRERLKSFVDHHGDHRCPDAVCLIESTRAWVEDLAANGFPEEELLLVGLALQAYQSSHQKAEKRVGAYKSAMTGYLAKQMSRADLEDAEEDAVAEEPPLRPVLRLVPRHAAHQTR